MPSPLIAFALFFGQIPNLEAGNAANWPLEKIIANIRAETQSLQRLAASRALRVTDGSRAVDAAIQRGEPAMKALAALLDDEAPIVRQNAIWALSRFRTEAAELLVLRSLRDPDAEARRTAFAALRSIWNPTIRKELVATLGDKHVDNRVAALRQLAFSRLEPPTTAMIGNYDRNVLTDAVARLIADPEPQVREQLAQTLGSYRDSNTVVHLLKLLGDEQAPVRAAAAAALGDANLRSAVPPLIEALRDADPNVVGEAAQSLGRLEDPIAVEPLLNLLRDDPRHRAAIVRSLELIGDRRAAPELLKHLDDDNDRVRWNVYAALGKLNDARAVEPMAAQLRKRPEDVLHLAKPLGQFNDARAVAPLVEAMFAQAESQSVSHAVMGGLALIRDPAVIRELAERARAQPATFAAFVARRDFHLRYRLAPDDPERFALWWEAQKRLYSPPEPRP